MKRLSTLLSGLLVAAVLVGSGVAQGYHGYGRGAPARGAAPYGGPARGTPYGGRGPGFAPRPAAPQGYDPRGYPGRPRGSSGPIYGDPFMGPPVRRPNSLGADWRQQQDMARQGVRQGQFAPLGRVIQGIRQQRPGRQLDAGIEYMGGRPVYRVRWLTARGERIDYIVDAASGAILSGR